MGNEDERFDPLLDEALQSYSAEPRAGLEQRVLSRVRAGQRKRRFRVWAFLIPIPAMAFALFFLIWTPPARLVEKAPLKHAPLVAATVKVVPEAPILKHKRRRAVMTRPFPTPAPLTDEEKALMKFVASGGTVIPVNDNPIEIKELQIPPLQSDVGQ